MKTVTILLLLIVQAFGRNPFPDYIKESFIDPSIAILTSNYTGTTVLRPNDPKLLRIVKKIVDRENTFVDNKNKELVVKKIGKVELKVIDDDDHTFVKNIFSFEKIICESRDKRYVAKLSGSVSFTYDEDYAPVRNYIFMKCDFIKAPYLFSVNSRRHSEGSESYNEIPEKPQRRHSLNSEMDRHRNVNSLLK